MKTVIKQGRPPIVRNIIAQNIILFKSLNNREITERLLKDRTVRSKLKGGMKGDREAQFRSLFVTVNKYRNQKISEGKKIAEFKGRVGVGGKLLKRWSRPAPVTRKRATKAE